MDPSIEPICRRKMERPDQNDRLIVAGRLPDEIRKQRILGEAFTPCRLRQRSSRLENRHAP